MRSSSRFKLSTALSLLLIFVVGLTLLGSTSAKTHAASRLFEPSTKLSVKASCGAWSVISSPNVAGYSSILYGVTALSVNNVWAVGYYQNASGTFALTLIEHWNGTKWSIVPSPNAAGAMYSILNSVVALSANNIWAVGYSLYPPPSSGGSSYDRTLVEHWNGTRWRVVSSPNPVSSTSIFTGITASSLNNAWAVGYYAGGTLIEHWNGTSWSIIPSPSPGSNGSFLNGVATISASLVRAAGYYQDTNGSQPLIENWDGTTWSIVPSPPAVGSVYNVLNGITALSANNNWAVGYFINASSGIYQTLTEQWNGTIWNVVPSPNIGTGHNRLTAVTHVPGTNKTWAVGYYNGATIAYQTLIEFYC